MSALKIGSERGGAVVRLTLAKPKGNVLDAELVGALRDAIANVPRVGLPKLVVIDHEGPHFSFGASVEEHVPDKVRGMLEGFHAMFRELEALGVPTAAIVRGQCLGGGLELALAAGQIFCDASARFAAAEVKLGVFPPVASVLLPLRVGAARAAELVISGRTVGPEQALRIGLVDEVAADPWVACLAWYDGALGAHSAVAVRAAWKAARRPYSCALGAPLAAAERQYLDDLMTHRDPVEGLRAFLDRRPPNWEHR